MVENKPTPNIKDLVYLLIDISGFPIYIDNEFEFVFGNLLGCE